MKAQLNIKLATILLGIGLISSLACGAVNSGIKEWYGNKNFSFSEKNDLLNVVINKNPWEAFTLNIDNLELMNNPVIEMELSSDQSVTLRVDISDGTFVSSQTSTLQITLVGNGMFDVVTFDFSDVLNDVNLNENAFLVFYVNPGQKFNGEITFKNIRFFSKSENQQNTVPVSEDLVIYPSPAKSFTNVIIPDNNFDYLSIMDMSGKMIIKIDVTNYNGTTYRVDLTNLAKGNYLVQLFGDDSTRSTKLIIN